MQYAILCYHDEGHVWSWSKEEEEAVMGRLAEVRGRLAAKGKKERKRKTESRK